MILQRVLGIALVAALGACAGLDNLGANQQSRVVKQNGEVELAHWAYWDNQCQGEPFETTIIAPPQHGRTELRDAVFAIPARTSSGATTGCVDQIVESTKVFYLPNEGYTGSDTVVVEFAGSSGIVRNVYKITVR